MRMRCGWIGLALVILATGLSAQRGSLGVALLAAADANADGKVDSGEWKAFAQALHPDAAGGVSSDLMKAHLLRRGFDRDADGKILEKDLQALFAAWDANGDGRVGRSEWGGGSQGRRGGFATEIVCVAADPDEKNEVTAEAWQKFKKALGEDPQAGIPMSEVARWIAAAQKRAPANRNAINASVYLTTMDGQLDRDRNGKLTLADLDALFGSLDANGDGVLTSEEARPRRTRPTRMGQGQGQVQRQGRQGWRGRVTAADKARPCLIPWQRSLEDALALVKKTGKPLLICVNMDGEAASEALTWGRYRDPAFAKLARGFIPVLASPDRHSPRDHDDHGRRLVDPRFGRLVDAEHIRIEPELFARYFHERRVAPRHVGVSPEGKILFDLFLLRDLSIIDDKLAEFGKPGALPDPMKLDESHLLSSPDAACRDRLEALYRQGDRALRRRLAVLSLAKRRSVQHPEILRMALRDRDPSVRMQAVETLALHPGPVPVQLFGDAFFVAAGDIAMQQSLVEALRASSADRKDPKEKGAALQLAARHSALLNRSRLLDLEAWTLTLAAATPVPDPPLSVEEIPALSEELGRLDQELEKHPEDAFLQLRSAELNWRFARVRMAQTKNPMFLLEDVKAASRRALAAGDDFAGEPRARAQALLALGHHYLDEGRDALFWSRRALPGLRDQAADPLVHQVLDVFLARGRAAVQAHIEDAAALAAQDYLVADLLAGQELRLRMPAVRERDYVQAAGFLQRLGAQRRELALLRKGLLAFPRSGQLHANMRVRMLESRGARALRDWYASYRITGPDAPWAQWFAGLGLHHAAERFLANRQPAEARDTWEQSFARFRASFRRTPGPQVDPFASSSAPFRAQAWAGLSQIALADHDLEEATRTLLEAFQTHAKGYQDKDSLGQSPLDIALRLLPLLQEAGLENQASTLRATLEAVGWKAPQPRRGRRR